MSSTVKLEIITLTSPLYNGRVISLTVPASDGEITILPNHIPLMTLLKAGKMVLRHESVKDEYVVTSGGFLVITPNKITILLDSAEIMQELDEKKIQEAKDQAEKLLTYNRAFADIEAKLQKSIIQIRSVIKKKFLKG